MPAPTLTLRAQLRALPRAAWVLFLGTFLNKFGAFVLPFLTLYLTGRGYSLAVAGLALSAYGVGNLTASLVGGDLADRIGRCETIALSMFSGAAAMLLLSQARNLPEIFALAALAGLTGEMYRPACSALLADLVPAEQRVPAFAAMRAAFNAGWAFGPAIAGFLAARGYFWLFAGDAFTSALFGGVALLALPRRRAPPTRRPSWGDVARLGRADPTLPWVLAASFLIALIFFQPASSFGLHVEHLGFSASTYGQILSLNGALVVLCELPLTTLTRRFPARRVIALGYLCAGLGFALNGWAHTVPALIACMVVFTTGEMLAMPVASAFIANRAPPEMRGRYMGAYGLTWSSALIVGPSAGIALLAAGPAALWVTCGALGALAAALILTAGAGPAGPPVTPGAAAAKRPPCPPPAG